MTCGHREKVKSEVWPNINYLCGALPLSNVRNNQYPWQLELIIFTFFNCWGFIARSIFVWFHQFEMISREDIFSFFSGSESKEKTRSIPFPAVCSSISNGGNGGNCIMTVHAFFLPLSEFEGPVISFCRLSQGTLFVIWRQGKPLETILIIFKSIIERCTSFIWSVFYMICPVCHIFTSF